MVRQTLIFIFSIALYFSCFSQMQKTDTSIFKSDTTKIEKFRKDGKVSFEEDYVNKILVCTKAFFYGFDNYGYLLTIKNSTKPKPGVKKIFYLNGQLMAEMPTLGGKYNGAARTYYPSGQPQCFCNYKNGERDSIQTGRFETGEISSIANFKDGKEIGPSILYHKNGKVWSEVITKNGKFWTVLSNFDQNGKPQEKGTLKDGTGTRYIYSDNGLLEEIEHYKNGKVVNKEKINDWKGDE